MPPRMMSTPWPEAFPRTRGTSSPWCCSPSQPRQVSSRATSWDPTWRAKLFEGTDYEESSLDELPTFRYECADGPVEVFQHALDIRDMEADEQSESGDEIMVFYHYTNELAFRNVANLDQTTAELFASLPMPGRTSGRASTAPSTNLLRGLCASASC